MENNKTDLILGAGAGLGTYVLTERCARKGCRYYFRNNRPKISEQEAKQLENYAWDVYSRGGFKANGLKIIEAGTQEFEDFMRKTEISILNRYNDKLKNTKNPIKKFFINRSFDKAIETFKGKKQDFLMAKNASYCHGTTPKAVCINMKEGAHMFFHELGHVIDFEKRISPKAGVFLKSKYLLYSPLALALTAALTTSKPEKDYLKDKNTGKFEKCRQFVKNNAGIIATLGYFPLLASESMANLNGQKLAGKYLPKNLQSILTKSHLHSMLGYMSVPMIVYGSVRLASAVRDKIVQKN